MSRLTMKQAADILGVHGKTLERYISTKPDFVEQTGHVKNAINGRGTFDEAMFRSYAARVTGNESLRAAVTGTADEPATAADTIIDGAIIPPMNVESGGVGAMIHLPAQAPAVPVDFLREIRAALILPHKLFLTLREASELTGLPMSRLKCQSCLLYGRRVIPRGRLAEI